MELLKALDEYIPEPVRDIYKQWRPSPLYRARKFMLHSNRLQKLPMEMQPKLLLHP